MPKFWFSFSAYKFIKFHHLLHKLVSISPSPSPNFISIRSIHLLHFNRINYLGSRLIPVINLWISFTCNMCKLYTFVNCVCVFKYFLFWIGCSCVCAKFGTNCFSHFLYRLLWLEHEHISVKTNEKKKNHDEEKITKKLGRIQVKD